MNSREVGRLGFRCRCEAFDVILGEGFGSGKGQTTGARIQDGHRVQKEDYLPSKEQK